LEPVSETEITYRESLWEADQIEKGLKIISWPLEVGEETPGVLKLHPRLRNNQLSFARKDITVANRLLFSGLPFNEADGLILPDQFPPPRERKAPMR
jgi:hypothetical protein